MSTSIYSKGTVGLRRQVKDSAGVVSAKEWRDEALFMFHHLKKGKFWAWLERRVRAGK